MKAYLYNRTEGLIPKKAMERAGIQVYNTTNQWKGIEKNKRVLIFCDNLINKTPHNDTKKVSKSEILTTLQGIIDTTDKDSERIKAMTLQFNVLNDVASDLDYTKPIYIVTGARRTPRKVEPST